MNDEVLRKFDERLRSLRALEERRQTVLTTIEGLGQLTDELRTRVEGAMTSVELEDIYRPYRPKRRTRAMIAREKGLLGLAEKSEVRVVIAIRVRDRPLALADVLVGPLLHDHALLRTCDDLALDLAGVEAALVAAHVGGDNAVEVHVARRALRDVRERRRDEQRDAALAAPALHLRLAQGAVALLEHGLVEVVHDLADLLGGASCQRGEDDLARLLLALGQVRRIADAPPAQARGLRGRQEATGEQVAEEQEARLPRDEGAVKVEHGEASAILLAVLVSKVHGLPSAFAGLASGTSK